MNIIQTLKQIDHIIGPVLLKLFPKTAIHESKTRPVKKILVIRPGGMGDALLLVPALKEIAVSLNIKIDVLCEPRNENVFKNIAFLNQVFSCWNLYSILLVFQRHYDMVFDTEQSHFLSAIFTKLVKADLKIGFKTMGREKMYNKTMVYRHNRYEAIIFWELFSTVLRLGKPFYFNFPYFNFPGHNHSLPLKKNICLFPGATINERLWPEKRWAAVMDFIAHKNFKPVLIGGKKELNTCKKIMAHCRTNTGINLCGTLSIPETAALFNQSKLLISTDSGILHLGILCNIPTVSLFGSGIADKWAPKGKHDFVINKMLSCSPCTVFGTTPACPNKNICMTEITIQDVIEVLRKSGIF